MNDEVNNMVEANRNEEDAQMSEFKSEERRITLQA